MKNVVIQQCVLGMVRTNCYFLMNKESKELLIVDPADSVDTILQMIQRMEGKPVGILLTHGHHDHILAANSLKEKYGVKIYAHEKEKDLLGNPQWNLSGGYGMDCSVFPDVLLKDNEEILLAGFPVKIFHTPGHTAGSCCYYFSEEDILISGDTLFCESVGRTDLYTGNTSEIIESLHRLLEELPDETDVLPGHDATTTIQHEKRYNPFV